MDQERIRKALDQLIYLPSLKEQSYGIGASKDSKPEPSPEPSTVATGTCRPWDRQDLNRRLQTFKASTWFCKPEKAGAVNCALHGWTNSGPDTLTCEGCGASISFKLPPGLSTAEQTKAAEAFAQKLNSGHGAGCPWIGNACDEDLASYPPYPQPQVLAGFNSRLSEARQLTHQPAIASAAVKLLSQTHRTQLQQLLSPSGKPLASGGGLVGNAAGSAEDEFAGLTSDSAVGPEAPAFEQRAKVLAACGWRTRLLPAPRSAELKRWDSSSKQSANLHRAVLHCQSCGAQVGLWAMLPRAKPDASKTPQPPTGSSQAVTMIASLAQSIAGGAASKTSTVLPTAPLPAFGASPAFGAPRDAPVFRSLSRSLSAAAPGELALTPSPKAAGPRPGVETRVGSPATPARGQIAEPSSASQSLPGLVTNASRAETGSQAAAAPCPPPTSTAVSKSSPVSSQQPPGTTPPPQEPSPEVRSKPPGGKAADHVASPAATAADAVKSSTPRARPFGSRDHLAPAFGKEAMRSRPANPRQASLASSPQLQASTVDKPASGSTKPSPMGKPAAAATVLSPKKALSSVPAESRKRDRPSEGSDRDQTKRLRSVETLGLAQSSSKPSQTPEQPIPRVQKPRLSPATELEAFDPIKQHRPFCSWVLCKGNSDFWRCGWKWTLETLAPGEKLPDLQQSSGAGPKRSFDSAARLRQAIERVRIIRK